MTVTMWEAVVAPGRLEQAQAWLREVAAGCRDGRAFTDGQERIVLICQGAQTPVPPEGLVLRSHGWAFEEL